MSQKDLTHQIKAARRYRREGGGGYWQLNLISPGEICEVAFPPAVTKVSSNTYNCESAEDECLVSGRLFNLYSLREDVLSSRLLLLRAWTPVNTPPPILC